MIDKPDPKDGGRTDGPGAKRPHATLDLKATEVKPPVPTPGQSTSAASAASRASSTETPSAVPGANPASSSAPSSSTPPSSGTSGPSAAASSTAGKASPTSADASGKSTVSSASPKTAPATAKPEPKPGSKSGGGVLSHLAAGAIGGGLVYAGAAFLGPGWLPNASHDTTSELTARIASLEAASKDSDALAAKIGDAESRLAKLNELEQTVTALREEQGTLQTETKSLAEAAQHGSAAENTERLTKLEEQLAMLAAAAPNSDGRVPQLAAITGKISDLETSLSNQVSALRKSLPSEVDERIAKTAETSEAAKAASARLDREVSQLRTDQARNAQKVEAAKADTDRLTAAVDAVKEETARVSSTVGELRSSVDSQLKAVARPGDISAAIGPVTSKLAEVEQNVQNVVKSEQSRKQNAERIVLSLELSNLKRALDRGQGQGYAAELEEVRKASGGQLDLSSLERFALTGVATPTELKAEFRPVMNAVIDADHEPADGSVIDRLLAGAKSVVRVRKISHEPGDQSTEAIVARIETALNEGRLGDVIAQAKTLPQRAQAPIEDWLIKVTARQSVDQAIAAVEARLKASLSGAPDAPAAAPPAPAGPAPAQN